MPAPLPTPVPVAAPVTAPPATGEPPEAQEAQIAAQVRERMLASADAGQLHALIAGWQSAQVA